MENHVCINKLHFIFIYSCIISMYVRIMIKSIKLVYKLHFNVNVAILALFLFNPISLV